MGLAKWSICPPAAGGGQPNGYFDFLEDGRRYGRRITDPDPG